MQYNFDTVIDRRNTNAVKWDLAAKDELPMWVADMDFETAPQITAAILKRAEHGVYGYNTLPESYYQAICSWWETRHHYQMKKSWILFCIGVIPAVTSIVKRVTEVGDNVALLSPVYDCFYRAISDSGRNPLTSEMRYDGARYEIDFADLERKLALPQTNLFILCNPHNPIGRIWDSETLRRIGALCLKHHVLVLSDEIHCDLTDPGCVYIPYASLSEEFAQNSVTCIAPSKTFNMAGLQSAAVVVPNRLLRERIARGLSVDELNGANAFAIAATVAAYSEGGEWLDALRQYIHENREITACFLRENLPQVKLLAADATYLLWMDCSSFTDDSDALQEYLRKEAGLFLSRGSAYRGNGNRFLRMNIACPKALLIEGLNRLKAGVEGFIAQNR